MKGQESIGNQELLPNQEAISELEGALSDGNELAKRTEQQNEMILVEIESLPATIDTAPYKEKITKLQGIQAKIKQTVLAASFLALVQGNALAESTPKDQDSAPQTQEQLETIPAPSITVEETNMTLEIIKGVANMALEQKKKDINEVLQGVNTKGEEVSAKDRIEKASGMIPSQIPKLGNIASVLSMVIDIQREISEAKPGYEKNIASRFARLLVDIPTQGLASFAWEILSKNQQNKDTTTESVTSERN